jgi:DNA-binding protein H-NS
MENSDGTEALICAIKSITLLRIGRSIMANLKGMNVEALMSLRKQVDARLVELRTELQKQLAALDGQAKGKARISSSLKGRKVPPKYRSRSGETWAGRGARPKWMVAALKKGKKLEDFLIKRLRS